MLHAKALPLFAVLVLASRPDEGQWLPSQIRAMDWQALRKRGLQLEKDQLWHPERGGLLNAAVTIGMSDQGGCSAAFVSPEGLIITNHHCGDDAISELSSLKRNYLKEGFVARSRVQELETGMVVHVVTGIRDVTELVHAAQARAENALQMYEMTQAEIRRLITEGETDPASGRKDPRITCHVASFFEGREYHLYSRTRITDVRLVYAPPIQTTDFGGDIDNWEWPRHSGDFALFRAYVAPDGTPRSFDNGNVPFTPQHSLTVSTEGVNEGDLVMIIGYPAQTSRYLTSVAVQEWQGFHFPKQRYIVQQITSILDAAAQADAERAIKLTGVTAYFSNIEKNRLGQLEGLARNAVVDRKISEEEAFTAWAKQTNRSDYLEVLNELLDLDHRERATQEKDLVVGLLHFMQFRRLAELLPLLSSMTTLIREAKDSEEGEQVAYPAQVLETVGSETATADLEVIQKPLLEILLEEARNLPTEQALKGAEVLADADVPAYAMVDDLLAETAMLSGESRLALLKAGSKAIAASADPLVVLMRGLVEEIDEFQSRRKTQLGQRLVVGRRWIEAQQAWRGHSFYPDANRTMRVSIADVCGYRPRDAVSYGAFTTVAGMLEKQTAQPPFQLPEMLAEAAKRRWLSRFRHRQLGDVPVCFLANGDTSNGNSGSPVINGKGELVGLNFDRVFENVSCDFGWDADCSRNISLDIRFVLWHMESVMPAPHLLHEMGVQ